MQTSTLAFIGAGNMGHALIGGLLADGVAPDRIIACEPDAERRNELAGSIGIQTAASNIDGVARADVVVLAVKPQILGEVCRDIAPAIRGSGKLVVSVAAGIRTASIDRWLGGDAAIVRVMPNTPALVGAGASALYANPRCTEAQRDLAEALVRAVGIAVWVDDEALIDTVTALSGSGPAYFFLFIEALEAAAVKLGLEADAARLLATQTAFGAARMALESPEDPATLRQRVTSPGGTTEAALGVLSDDLHALVEQALRAAEQRSVELADAFGKD